jgi:hypothetical protein
MKKANREWLTFTYWWRKRESNSSPEVFRIRISELVFLYQDSFDHTARIMDTIDPVDRVVWWDFSVPVGSAYRHSTVQSPIHLADHCP